MTAAPAPPTNPPSLRYVGARVETRLEDLMAEQRRHWGEVDRDLLLPLDALAQMVLGGGKRLRPAFCYWGFVAAGGATTDSRVIDAGAAFELLQASALIHDDIMDGSDIRRATRTTHLSFGDKHASQDWTGEDRRFGEGVGILIGNIAHVLADRLMSSAVGAAASTTLPVWAELRLELNMGQYLDLLGSARRDTGTAKASLIARYKSGKYSVERPLHIGAALAGRYDDLQPLLSAYGDPLGEAFQLRDDLLDLYGDETQIGKPLGGDLREGKPTVLLAEAIARCPSDLPLLERVGQRDLKDTELDALRELIESLGARTAIEQSIEELHDRAVDALVGAPIPPEASAALIDLASFVSNRQR